MKIDLTCVTVSHVFIILVQRCLCTGMTKGKVKRWYVGRTPPSSFEYHKINGFYSPKQAKVLCEGDVQCGGFTFKGSKRIAYMKREVHFFHYINEHSSFLTTSIKYPHWTTFIVGSRDHIVVTGSYPSHNSSDWRRLNRYHNFQWPHAFELKVHICNKNILAAYIAHTDDYFRNSADVDLTGNLTWAKITSLTETIPDSIAAIVIKGRIK